MTVKEYEQLIGNKLVTAYNDEDMAAVMPTFKGADQTLESNKFSSAERKDFWEEVRKVVDSGKLLLRKQANSALILLMQTIEKEIAARTGKAQ